MCNAAFNACWDYRDCDWTEQLRHDQARQRPLPNIAQFMNFSERDLINNDSSFCSLTLSATDLQRHVFSFWKAFVKCPSLSVDGIFDDVRYDFIST